MESNLKRAVIYCRVSTKEQVEEGNSLVTQEKNCREYAVKNGYQIAEVFIELGESAKTADRTELQKLFVYCANRKNKINAVIAYKIDRVSRNTDDYSQIRILLKRYGVEIKSTSEYFEDTPAGRFMENIIANVAQFDNDVRTERSVEGMKQAVAEGRYIWPSPLGYSNVKTNGKANIEPDNKAEIVKFIFQQIANKTMTVEGTRLFVVKNSKVSISKSSFYRLLGNKLYAGKIIKFGSEYQGAFEPLITEALYYQVQQVMKRRYAEREYLKEHPDFPLRRFVKSSSGLNISGCWCKGRNNRYPYYRIPDNKKLIPKDALESAFMLFLNTFSINKAVLKDLKEKIISKFKDSSNLKKISTEKLLAIEQKLKEKRKLLVEKNLNGILSDDILKEQLEDVNSELWTIQDKLAESNPKIIDLEFIFTRLNKMLIDPGQFWKKQPPHIKSSLQRFEFPEGITWHENNFQTKKICSIYKLKNAILTDFSLVGCHPKPLKKHHESANSPTSQDAELHALFETIQSDLVVLDEILSLEECQDTSSLTLPSSIKKSGVG